MMIVLNNLLRLGMVDLVDEVLDDNLSQLNKISKKSFLKFLKVYLNRPFNKYRVNPFEVFRYIDYSHLKIDEFDEVNNILIESKYFSTICEEKILEALLGLYISIDDPAEVLSPFIKYLISKITDSKILLHIEESDLAFLVSEYNGLGLEDKLKDLGDLELIGDISQEFNLINAKAYLNYFSENLSLEEMKVVCLKGDFYVEDVFDVLFKHYDENRIQVLDSLFEVMVNKKRKYPVIDAKSESEVTAFEQYLDEINRRNLSDEDKDYLALKLVDARNYPLMLDWIHNIECDANKNIIDALIGKATEFVILFSVTNKYVSYAVKKILEQGETNYMEINTFDAIFLGNYDIERLESILDSIYAINPNVKFSKKTAIYLLKLGVNKFPVLINEYDFTSNEKLEIFEALKEINSDWIIVYGVYLLGGDTPFDSSKGEQIMTNIRARKKHEEM